MDATLLETLDHLEIGARVSYGPLHLFPLCGGAFTEENISFLEDALKDGTTRVEELGEAASVPELSVINEGASTPTMSDPMTLLWTPPRMGGG